VALQVCEKVTDMPNYRPDYCYYTVLCPLELSEQLKGKHNYEAEWVIRRGYEALGGREGFVVIEDPKRWKKRLGQRVPKRFQHQPTAAVFFPCTVEEYLANPLKAEELLYTSVLKEHELLPPPPPPAAGTFTVLTEKRAKVNKEAKASPMPRKEKVCKFHNSPDGCTKGDACKFSHDSRVAKGETETDALSGVFERLQLNTSDTTAATAMIERAPTMKCEFRLSMQSLKSAMPNGFLLLCGSKKCLEVEFKRASDAFEHKHADCAKLLVAVPFSLLNKEDPAGEIEAYVRNETLNHYPTDYMPLMRFELTHHTKELIENKVDHIEHCKIHSSGAALQHMHFAVAVQECEDATEIDLPGGKRNLGEDSLVTALRETWEETNMRVLGFDPASAPKLGYVSTGNVKKTGHMITSETCTSDDQRLLGASVDRLTGLNVTFTVFTTADCNSVGGK
jgi:hypothetical protein